MAGMHICLSWRPVAGPWAASLAVVVVGAFFARALAADAALVGTNAPSAEAARLQSAIAELPAGRSARELAQIVCSGCHLFPAPELLDKRTWKDFVLPRMNMRLGLQPPDYESHPEGALIKAARVLPDAPMISPEAWQAIQHYYLSTAPDTALPQGPRAEIQPGLRQFTVAPPYHRLPTPLTSLVQISQRSRRIFVGDDGAKSLAVLNSEGELLESLELGNTPSCLVETDAGLFVTCIGSFQPSEARRGAVLFIPTKGGAYGRPKTLLKELPRTTHIELADFNGDGRQDFALCQFGDWTGAFSWFENLGADQYREHVLLAMPGSVRSVARDFDGNGTIDLAVLVAQNLESLLLFFNDGQGHFRPHLVFQRHPVFGHNSFEAVDFNQDGRLDFLVTNGDNGEYESCTKNYHGVRLYLDQGGNRYEEAFFYPLNGAVRALARDFDGDGDLDIAAISFFPDYRQSPQESFVYLENLGGLRFAASSFRECLDGRWLVMDTGDVDGDGDLDLVLGSYIKGPTSVPLVLMQRWERDGPSIQILRNTLR